MSTTGTKRWGKKQSSQSALALKVRLRQEAWRAADRGLVVCGFGGTGDLHALAYGGAAGIAIEQRGDFAEVLAQRFPSWRVYRGDCVALFAAGVLLQPPAVLDLDAYGSPWLALEAALPFCTQTTQVVFTDGGLLHLRRAPQHIGHATLPACFAEPMQAAGHHAAAHWAAVLADALPRLCSAGEVLDLRVYFGGSNKAITYGRFTYQPRPVALPDGPASPAT